MVSRAVRFASQMYDRSAESPFGFDVIEGSKMRQHQPTAKTIEIRRHAERHKPGANLNARGVARAGNASARARTYALVVTSPMPRAIQTAVAMGHGVDEEDWTMASMGGALNDFPWDVSFAAMQREIRDNLVAGAWATLQSAQLRYWLSRIEPGEALLVVSHGGIAEAGIIGLLGDTDVSALGSSLGYSEGARLVIEGDRVTGVDLLRFNDDDEEYVALSIAP
jgi:broad specificity phosphatase PhoE